MPLKQTTITSYDSLRELLENYRLSGSHGRLILFFVSNVVDGKTWCPDCEKDSYEKCLVKEVTVVVLYNQAHINERHPSAFPYISDALGASEVANATVSIHFVTVYVGTKEEWKTPESKYRTDEELHLTAIPTLVEVVKDGRRLVEKDLLNLVVVKQLILGN